MNLISSSHDHKLRSQLCFRINDRVISANNISLEGVDYAGAVQVLRDSGQTVNLVVKRRVVLPNANASSSGLGEQTIRYVHGNGNCVMVLETQQFHPDIQGQPVQEQEKRRLWCRARLQDLRERDNAPLPRGQRRHRGRGGPRGQNQWCLNRGPDPQRGQVRRDFETFLTSASAKMCPYFC